MCLAWWHQQRSTRHCKAQQCCTTPDDGWLCRQQDGERAPCADFRQDCTTRKGERRTSTMVSDVARLGRAAGALFSRTSGVNASAAPKMTAAVAHHSTTCLRMVATGFDVFRTLIEAQEVGSSRAPDFFLSLHKEEERRPSPSPSPAARQKEKDMVMAYVVCAVPSLVLHAPACPWLALPPPWPWID